MAEVFSPLNKSFSASVTTTSGSTTFAVDPTSPQLCIHNDGSNTALINWGGSTVTASTSDLGWLVSIPSGAVMSITKGSAAFIAAICATGTATLRVSQGVGP